MYDFLIVGASQALTMYRKIRAKSGAPKETALTAAS
jgi:hypothetical protein